MIPISFACHTDLFYLNFRMDPLDVSLERVWVGEDLAADVASEEAVAGVNAHVVTKLLAFGKLLAAVFALLQLKNI